MGRELSVARGPAMALVAQHAMDHQVGQCHALLAFTVGGAAGQHGVSAMSVRAVE